MIFKYVPYVMNKQVLVVTLIDTVGEETMRLTDDNGDGMITSDVSP